MLRALASENIPWNEVHLMQVDERVAPPDILTETLPTLAKAC
jgi:6-phosphogluconolactonase/glucosamine-6-phosphate isomerase/deaminase